MFLNIIMSIKQKIVDINRVKQEDKQEEVKQIKIKNRSKYHYQILRYRLDKNRQKALQKD